MNYKIILHGSNMYKEFMLDEQFKGSLTMGTLKECQICFQQERFYTNFLLRLDKTESGEYALICNETIFFRKENGLKEYVRILKPGDRIEICYDATESEFFYLDFTFDFKQMGMDYNLAISCSGFEQLTVGGKVDCDVRIDNPLLCDDYIIVTKEGMNYYIDSTNTRYGAEINGFPSKKPQAVIRNGEFFSFYGYSFNINNDILYTTKNAVVITKYTINKLDNQRNHLKYPRFIRNVRQQYRMPEEAPEVLKPKAKDTSEEQNFLLSALPMLVNMVLMIAVRGIMGGGGAFVIYFALMMVSSLAISVYTFMDGRKKKKEKEEKRVEVYMKYLTEQEDNIIKLREKEKILANQMNPGLDEYMEFIKDFDGRLFEKEKQHMDYLSVRLGKMVTEYL